MLALSIFRNQNSARKFQGCCGSTFKTREQKLRSAALFAASENPVQSTIYQDCLQWTLRVFSAASHEPAYGSAAFHVGFVLDVKQSTFHRRKDEVSLNFLLFGTGLFFSSILS